MQSSLKTKCHQSFLSTKVNSFIVLQHATNPYIHPGHHFPPFVLHTPQDKSNILPGHHFFCSEDPPRQTYISTLDTISTIHPPSRTNQTSYTAPQHLVCRVVQSLHTNHMQMSIIEVFICRRLHMNTSMIPVCIWLICRLCTALHTKCCGAVLPWTSLFL